MTWNCQKNSWKKFIGELSKKWTNCGCKLLLNMPFLTLIIKAKPSILILPEFEPKMWILASWWYWIGWLDNYIFLQGYGFVRIFTTHLFSNYQLKKNQKFTNANLSSKLFQDDSSDEKKSVCWVCVITQKGHIVGILPYSQLCCLPYLFAEEHNCDMHPYSTKSRYVKYAGLFNSQLIQLIQYPHVSSFSTVSPITLLEKMLT